MNNQRKGQMIILSLCLILFFTSVKIFAEDIKTIIKGLEKRETRIEATRKIEKVGKPAIKHLRQIMKDKNKDKDTKISSIILLGKLKAKEAKNDLEEVLLNDKDDFMREASVIALGNLGEKEAIPNLKKALNDQSVNVRMRAAWALGKVGEKSGKELALKTLTEGEDVAGKLLASEALESIGDKYVIPQLQQYLNDRNVWTRIYAKLTIKKLELVGLSEQQRLVFLKETLMDEQFEVNHWAVTELAKIVIAENSETKQETQENALVILKQAAKDTKIRGSYSARKVLQRLVATGKISEKEMKE